MSLVRNCGKPISQCNVLLLIIARVDNFVTHANVAHKLNSWKHFTASCTQLNSTIIIHTHYSIEPCNLFVVVVTTSRLNACKQTSTHVQFFKHRPQTVVSRRRSCNTKHTLLYCLLPLRSTLSFNRLDRPRQANDIKLPTVCIRRQK